MQIDKENVLLGIKEMLHQAYPTVEITMDTFLEYGTGTYLDMSSLEIVQFIVDVEQKYDIIIDFEDRYYTIGDVVNGVQSLLLKKDLDISEAKSE